MKVLGLSIPNNQSLWCWTNGEAATLLFAANEDEAYAKAIAVRLRGSTDPDVVGDERRWFAEHDQLVEITGEYTGPPFAGPLPDLDD